MYIGGNLGNDSPQIHTFIPMYTYTYMNVYTSSHIFIYVRVYIHMYIYICIYILIYMQVEILAATGLCFGEPECDPGMIEMSCIHRNAFHCSINIFIEMCSAARGLCFGVRIKNHATRKIEDTVQDSLI